MWLSHVLCTSCHPHPQQQQQQQQQKQTKKPKWQILNP